MFPTQIRPWKLFPHRRFWSGNIPETQNPFPTWNKWVKTDFYSFILSSTAPEMFPTRIRPWKLFPHRRFRSGNIPGTQGTLQTWNKWVKTDFYSFILSSTAPEMFPTRIRPWTLFPHRRFRLGNIPGTLGPLQTQNKWVKNRFHTFISSSTAPEMFPTRIRPWKPFPHRRFRSGNIPGPEPFSNLI